MFVKRSAELKLLNDQYNSPQSNLVILYGRKGIGKTSILKDLMEGKPAYYYLGVECEDRMQVGLMNLEWFQSEESYVPIQDYRLLFSSLIKRELQKTVIILDEFHSILKNSNQLLEAFQLVEESQTPVMFVLCSSSIRYVENEMVKSLGHKATFITAYLKCKELSFVDFVSRFPKTSVENCIFINSILGGIPDYLEEWDEDKTIRQNMIGTVLNKNSRLFFEPEHFLKQELREISVYNTILSSLASGNRKLNDLHRVTGYSRAKIIVYLKLLIELDIVEKLVPLSEEGKENAKKGLYRITDHFLSFWYRFVFPNLSELQLGRASQVYDAKIEPNINLYMEEYFSDVCMEYLKLMNLHQRLPVKYQWWERWYGKNGTIDIVAKSQNNNTLVGKCFWEDRPVDESDFDKLLMLSKEAGQQPESFYLFSKKGFTKGCVDIAKNRETIHLVSLEDL